MPRLDYKTCRNCNGHADDVGELSHTRLCTECSRELLYENIDGLRFKAGKPLAKWRRGMILSAGGVLPETLLLTDTERT